MARYHKTPVKSIGLKILHNHVDGNIWLMQHFGAPATDNAVSHHHEIFTNPDGTWGWSLFQERVGLVGAATILKDGLIVWIRQPE